MEKFLEIIDLKKSFKQKGKVKEVLKGLSLSVSKGEIYGFLGSNGAGKSTTIKIIMGFIFKDGGEVYIDGKNHNHSEVKRQVGFMPEHPYYPETLTGEEYLKFVSDINKCDYNEINSLLSYFELLEAKNRHIRNYSKGMIQRLGFASALIHNPDLYILDEPMSGLDPLGRYLFKKKMKELKENGKSIFFSSHIIPDMEDICDKVGIIKDGKIIMELDRNQFKHFLTEGFRVVVKGKKERIENFFDFSEIEENLLMIKVRKEDFYKVIDKLKDLCFEIIDIEPEKKDLEGLFIDLFGK